MHDQCWTDDLAPKRGITSKAKSKSGCIALPKDGNTYRPNLLIRRAHVDFSYEVSRALLPASAPCWLLTSSQAWSRIPLPNTFLAAGGEVRAQGTSHHFAGTLKIDLPDAQPRFREEQIENYWPKFPPPIALMIVRKRCWRAGFTQAIVHRIPPPKGAPIIRFQQRLRVFDFVGSTSIAVLWCWCA